MDRKTYILFDLDGTLTDPREGITKSVQYALKHYGIQVDDLDSLCPFIGPPLTDSFQKYFGFDHEKAREGVTVFRQYFSTRGWLENLEYPGIKEMLQALRDAGRVLLVATSKPEVFAKKILDRFGMTEYFDFIGGADIEETRIKKGDVIRYVMKECGLDQDEDFISRAVMVGDREQDVLGARELGMDCIGVLYGYSNPGELEECKAAHVVETVVELKDFLLSL